MEGSREGKQGVKGTGNILLLKLGSGYVGVHFAIFPEIVPIVQY